MIEVQLRPGVGGCVRYPLGCLTLGLFPVLTRYAERHFIRRMDETGVETRGGKRIGWNEFTRMQRVATTMGGGGYLSDEYQLHSPRGRVSLPMWRAENGQEALNFALARLPSTVEGRP